MKIDFPEGPPGVHPPTAAISRLLKFMGVINPLTNQPYSEALLLGIGGGIDMGYILYQFPHLVHPLLLLGFRNRWNNTRAFIKDLTDRLLVTVNFIEFKDQKTAQQSLQKYLKKGNPALVWVDKAHLPYHRLPDKQKGFINYQVVVYARDGRLWRLYLDDLSSAPFVIREKEFTSARANLSQSNFLMMVYDKAENINANELRNRIIEGIRICATRLTQPIKTIGISNMETWAKKLTDRLDHQGWPQVFKNQEGLFEALRTVYESIKYNGTEGFALRKLYADFLHEAAESLDNPLLNAITGQYLQLSNHWSNLGENALPSEIPDFDRFKSLLNKKYAAYRNHQMGEYENIADNLQALEEKIIKDFPLDKAATGQLFERLSNRIKLIAELEINAANCLRDVTQR